MGLSIKQLFDKWENFCYDLDLYGVDYIPTEENGAMDDIEMLNLFDATLDAFQEKMGYSDNTIDRLRGGPFGPDTIDIWFRGPWHQAGYALKEAEA